MSRPRSISVLMPTFQGARYLERVLAALAAQRSRVPWDLTVVDSGSTDGTLSILERWRRRFPVPFELRAIHPLEFDHGDTRNWLAAESQGELLVYLTQDAVPRGPRWLQRLARNFDDPAVGGAYSRKVPRADAELMTRIISAEDPGYGGQRREVRLPADHAALDPYARRLLYDFSHVAAAIRRELWERHPFPRTRFGEDLLMARALLEAGYTVVYDVQASVEHSHDYGPQETRARAEIDGRFNIEYLDRTCVGSPEDAAALVERKLALDRAALEAAGQSGAALERELLRARELRSAAFEGLYQGGRSARRRPASALRPAGPLHVLYVVHGFPPENWAGTEVYTLELAREMRRRGHRVTILARTAGRSGAAGEAGDLSIERGELDGLPVLRLTNRLSFESLRQTYRHAAVERLFRRVLLEVRPDVVHFQHLIHLSVGLIEVARDFGLPTVVHCHDYWPICARVQLIRPDGRRCEHNMGAGCFACVREQGLEHVERLAALDPAGPGVGAELLRAGCTDLEGLEQLLERRTALPAAWAEADLCISPSRFLREKLLATGAFDADELIYSDNGMRRPAPAGEARAPANPTRFGRLPARLWHRGLKPWLAERRERRPAAPSRPARAPGAPVRLAFVGSLVWYKGIELLLEAMAELAAERAVLDVHGAFEPERDALHRRLAARAGANVVFHGRFDNRRLAQVYQAIDVLVVPSLWYENSPITIHEAHLFSTPVVTSDIGGMAEYVRDGVDGLHFRAGDAGDLARVLLRCVREPGLIEALARACPSPKGIEANARELEYRYRALACRRRPRGHVRLFELAGAAGQGRRGAVELQGRDLLLLRPGASAEYNLSASGSGERRVSIELLALANEPELHMAGEVSLDGRALGRLGPFAPRGADQTHATAFEVELQPGARLTIRADQDTCLRVARVSVEAPVEALPADAPLEEVVL
jgi:glycosyltransferase involved in cell wall biosynthesis/GT2 family glycosyltransferase